MPKIAQLINLQFPHVLHDYSFGRLLVVVVAAAGYICKGCLSIVVPDLPVCGSTANGSRRNGGGGGSGSAIRSYLFNNGSYLVFRRRISKSRHKAVGIFAPVLFFDSRTLSTSIPFCVIYTLHSIDRIAC